MQKTEASTTAVSLPRLANFLIDNFYKLWPQFSHINWPAHVCLDKAINFVAETGLQQLNVQEYDHTKSKEREWM